MDVKGIVERLFFDMDDNNKTVLQYDGKGKHPQHLCLLLIEAAYCIVGKQVPTYPVI